MDLPTLLAEGQLVMGLARVKFRLSNCCYRGRIVVQDGQFGTSAEERGVTFSHIMSFQNYLFS